MSGPSRVSCSEFSFPALSLDQRLALVRLLGFGLVDVSLFLNTEAQVGVFLSDSAAQTRRIGEALERAALAPVDLFLGVGGDDFASGALTSPQPAQREHLRRVFLAALRCASSLGVPGLTVLPGVQGDHDQRGSWRLAVEELRWRVDQASGAGIQLRIEPHIASNVATPELTLALVEEVPGLRLSLDAGHFVFQAIPLSRIVPLAPLAGHVHLSAARAGGVCVRWKENAFDVAAFVAALQAAGYGGRYCIEYVPMEKWGADATDIISAIVAMREVVLPLVT
jgi:sugar phosphate isomerase/epimerase